MINTDSLPNHTNYLHQDKQCIYFLYYYHSSSCSYYLLLLHPVIHFSINKCMSMSEISSDSIPVILSIASQLNPGELK